MVGIEQGVKIQSVGVDGGHIGGVLQRGAVQIAAGGAEIQAAVVHPPVEQRRVPLVVQRGAEVFRQGVGEGVGLLAPVLHVDFQNFHGRVAAFAARHHIKPPAFLIVVHPDGVVVGALHQTGQIEFLYQRVAHRPVCTGALQQADAAQLRPRLVEPQRLCTGGKHQAGAPDGIGGKVHQNGRAVVFVKAAGFGAGEQVHLGPPQGIHLAGDNGFQRGAGAGHLPQHGGVAGGQAGGGDGAVGLAGGEVVDQPQFLVLVVDGAFGGVVGASSGVEPGVHRAVPGGAGDVRTGGGVQGVRVPGDGGVQQQQPPVEPAPEIARAIVELVFAAQQFGKGSKNAGHRVGDQVVVFHRPDLAGVYIGQFQTGMPVQGHGHSLLNSQNSVAGLSAFPHRAASAAAAGGGFPAGCPTARPGRRQGTPQGSAPVRSSRRRPWTG